MALADDLASLVQKSVHEQVWDTSNKRVHVVGMPTS